MVSRESVEEIGAALDWNVTGADPAGDPHLLEGTIDESVYTTAPYPGLPRWE